MRVKRQTNGNPIFTKKPQWIDDHQHLLDDKEYRVLSFVARRNDYPNPRKEFSARYVALNCNMSADTANRTMRRLEAAGLLIPAGRGGRGTKKYDLVSGDIERALERLPGVRKAESDRRASKRRTDVSDKADSYRTVAVSDNSRTEVSDVVGQSPSDNGRTIIIPQTKPLSTRPAGEQMELGFDGIQLSLDFKGKKVQSQDESDDSWLDLFGPIDVSKVKPFLEGIDEMEAEMRAEAEAG